MVAHINGVLTTPSVDTNGYYAATDECHHPKREVTKGRKKKQERKIHSKTKTLTKKYGGK
jgi:hypothetical protein